MPQRAVLREGREFSVLPVCRALVEEVETRWDRLAATGIAEPVPSLAGEGPRYLVDLAVLVAGCPGVVPLERSVLSSPAGLPAVPGVRFPVWQKVPAAGP